MSGDINAIWTEVVTSRFKLCQKYCHESAHTNESETEEIKDRIIRDEGIKNNWTIGEHRWQ